MNKVIIIGNLSKDPETKQTLNGKSVTRLDVAVNRRFKDAQGNKQTDFFTVIAWNQLSELCGRYLSKGKKIGVTGELQTRSYQAQDGSKRYVTEIIADEIEFLSPAGDNKAASPAAAGVPGLEGVDEEGLPF